MGATLALNGLIAFKILQLLFIYYNVSTFAKFAGILHKLDPCGISGWIFARFCLFSVINGFKWF